MSAWLDRTMGLGNTTLPERAMRPPHRILHRNRVHRLAAEHLQTHLQFKDYKRKASEPVKKSRIGANMIVKC